MNGRLRIARLADHPEVIPTIREWFETEWEPHYGPNGPGNAEQDLLAYANGTELPVGVVAFLGDEPCGIAALKMGSITTHAHLSPWAAAGMVSPLYRGQGIGGELLCAIEEVARTLGYAHIYCGTATANRLLERSGWEFMEQVRYSGENVSIYVKAL
ncbi:MAG: GNAT family N-acetyltransferase [Gemmatimonadaceae bacterium]|nr:GNAT family N-acetyltransferase [Gemmatimonadaceae bacterium]